MFVVPRQDKGVCEVDAREDRELAPDVVELVDVGEGRAVEHVLSLGGCEVSM